MNTTLLYDELLERKKNGEKLEIEKLTTEEWKQLCLHELVSGAAISELFEVSKSKALYYRKKTIGSVYKDYEPCWILFCKVLDCSDIYFERDYSVEFLEACNYKEAHYVDLRNIKKYKILFKLPEELERQKGIRKNNKSGKKHINTLMDKLFDMLYEAIETGYDKEFQLDYFVHDYDRKKEKFLQLYNKRKEDKLKLVNTKKHIIISQNSQVIDFTTTKPHVSEKKSKSKSEKQDYIKIAEAKQEVGNKGQEIVYDHECLILADFPNLKKIIEKTYEIDDTAGYDIKSFNEDGTIKYIEVKTNSSDKSDKRMTFFISANEDEFIRTHTNAYIYYVYNLENPKIKKIDHKTYLKLFKKPTQYLIDVDCE